MNKKSLCWQVCEELTDCPAGMSVYVLADELGASQQAIYKALTRLSGAGIVEKGLHLSRGGMRGRAQHLWKIKPNTWNI